MLNSSLAQHLKNARQSRGLPACALRGELDLYEFRAGILLVVFALAILTACGCQQKMADQPSFKPLQASEFFADGRSARPVVPGTIARGHLRTNVAFFTGRIEGAAATSSLVTTSDADSRASQPRAASALQPADIVPPSFRDDAAFVREFPVPVSEAMIQHGYNRYMIYCVVCHDPLGTGRGRIIERGYTPPPSFHIERLRTMPPGRMFAVITEGYGSMPSYANQIPPADRWAIAAYVRALQLSQHFPKGELTPGMQKEYSEAVATNAAGSKTGTGSQEGAP
jgi:mono/diheme cytochrome c family protein